MMGLGAPLALLGLAAVPVLVALYWLRTRSSRHPVSSLFLWQQLRLVHAGGRRVERQERSVLLVLELLILVLLAVAAAQPWLPSGRGSGALAVVLDDSFSMQAGESARRNAQRAVEQVLAEEDPSRVWWVVAGTRPELVAESQRPRAVPEQVLDRWQCFATGADLAQALRLAFDVAGPEVRVLVVSDHAADRPALLGNRVRWLAFGTARDNLALVAAHRRWDGERDTCLVQAANLGAGPARVRLGVEGAAVTPPMLELPAGGGTTVRLELPPGTGAVRLRLDEDALAADNQVVLVRGDRPPLRVANQVDDPELRHRIQLVLEVAGCTEAGPDEAHLVLTSRGDLAPVGEQWVVRFMSEPDAAAYVGPFVVDRSHPLAEGLDLRGVVWAAGRSTSVPGHPVLSAGNVVLVSESVDGAGRRLVRLRLRAERSTLLGSADWPILLVNLVAWRASRLPGPTRRNLLCGDEVELVLPHAAEDAKVIGPQGDATILTPVLGGAGFTVSRPGITRVESGGHEWEIAANMLNRDESDLSACCTQEWGAWPEDRRTGAARRGMAWAAGLAAWVLVLVHQVMVRRLSGGRG